MTIVEKVQESNTEMEPQDFGWYFNIDPSSYEQGGCPGVTKPAFARTCELTWKHHGVNCAAYALNYLMGDKNYNKNKSAQNQAVIDAQALQDKLGWGEYVTPPEIAKFVEAYDDCRVVVLIPAKSSLSYVYAGEKWTLPENWETVKDPKTYYLILHDRHYAALLSPANTIKCYKNRTAGYKWCQKCCQEYNYNQTHDCETRRNTAISKNILRKCPKCNTIGKHNCIFYKCRTCSQNVLKKTKKGEFHRCVIKEDEPEDEKKKFLMPGDAKDGKYPALWAYDFEARIQIKESCRQIVVDFPTDEDHQFPTNFEQFTEYAFEMHTHQVNFAAAKNIFTNERVEFFGDNAMRDFLEFCSSYNQGHNIMVAHNASGYDARLIFTAFNMYEFDFMGKNRQSLIMRGNKFMQIKANDKLIFRDSLLHLPQSLAALAKDFCTDTRIEKGFFPHLFNTIENYEYVGPIPELKYFDVSHVKAKKDLDALVEYHASWEGRQDWTFKEELKKYCLNDVDILCEIMRKYHENAMSLFKLSPWMKITAASYVHQVFLIERGQMLELPDKNDDPQLYQSRIEQAAESESWAVLQPTEYYFARMALRGGRTDVRKLYHAITPEQYERGERIRYQDICSEYPYQQVEHDFPVGVPTIYIYDSGWIPCSNKTHQDEKCLNSYKCGCNEIWNERKCNLQFRLRQQPTIEEMMHPDFFGFVCITAIPPKDLYHPVLVRYDQKAKKCISSCEIIEQQVFTTVEVQRAIQRGYEIKEVHR